MKTHPHTDWITLAKDLKASKRDASGNDVAISRCTGIDPNDVRWLRRFTLYGGLLVIIRCPPVSALSWHGKLPPKSYGASKDKAKSNERTGIAVDSKGRFYVSDYDLMSIHRATGDGKFAALPATGVNPEKASKMSDEATLLLRAVNMGMISRFQHGCQDDWDNANNRGVKADDRFAVFNCGRPYYIPNPNELEAFYRRHGVNWPYDRNGHYKLSWWVTGLA